MLTDEEKSTIRSACKCAGVIAVRQFVDEVESEMKRDMKIPAAPVTDMSQYIKERIELFMSLFHGRNDLFARRFESVRTGKSGYSPATVKQFYKKDEKEEYLPLDVSAIDAHLRGRQTVGIYPIVDDEFCHFLAIDFDTSKRSEDGTDWQSDISAFINSCTELGLRTAAERSRSGKGAHVWFFFKERVTARLARRFGVKLLTRAMQSRPELGFASYDRLFPNQDTVPKNGFGNLIALPLQGIPRQKGNSVFVNNEFVPYPDQWAFLSGVQKLCEDDLNRIIDLIPDEEVEEKPKPWERVKRPKLKPEDFPDRINITLSNMIYIEKRGLNPKLIYALKKLAAFRNPEFFKAQAMRLNTYNKPRIISCSDESEEYLHLPRGLLNEVEVLLSPWIESSGKKINIADKERGPRLPERLRIEDRRNSGRPLEVHFQGALRENQAEALHELVWHDNGILAGATAFGKTVVALGLIAQRKVNTLILVHRTQLAAQWKERIEKFLNFTCGQYGGGRHKLTGRIDVALIQSIAKKDRDGDIMNGYGMVIVDECHHVSAFSFEQVLKSTNAKYVYGLTATPKRQDGHDPIITMQCGPIRYNSDALSELNRHGFSHYVIPRFTRFKSGSDEISKIYEDMAANNFRNELIIKDILHAYSGGKASLVLCSRKSHVDILTECLGLHCAHVLKLVGGGSAKARKAEIARLNSIPETEPFVIVATGKYIGEGFDCARLDTMFLASPIAWRGTLEQYVGRLHRQYNSKHEVVVYDYADIQTPVLYKMYQKRLRGYFALGYTTKSTVDGNEDLIFNESNFAESFFDDIRQAKNRAVISAPRVRESSKQRLLDEAQGIEVKIYEQNYSFAIIDGCIVWYGEINLLSPNRFGDGLVIRIPSPELAAEFRTLLPEKTIQ